MRSWSAMTGMLALASGVDGLVGWILDGETLSYRDGESFDSLAAEALFQLPK